MADVNCAECSTPYRLEQSACPHCGSTAYTEGDVVVSRRLPLLVSVSCTCGLGPWQLRLPVVQTGLIQLPELHCASCGSQVQIPWPPTEDDMPKITRHGGPTNARAAAPSPDAPASQPLVGAEADQGHPTVEPVVADEVFVEVVAGEVLPEVADEAGGEDVVALDAAPDYEGMTLAELRALASERGVPSYGTKAQLTERLRDADAS